MVRSYGAVGRLEVSHFPHSATLGVSPKVAHEIQRKAYLRTALRDIVCLEMCERLPRDTRPGSWTATIPLGGTGGVSRPARARSPSAAHIAHLWVSRVALTRTHRPYPGGGGASDSQPLTLEPSSVSDATRPGCASVKSSAVSPPFEQPIRCGRSIASWLRSRARSRCGEWSPTVGGDSPNPRMSYAIAAYCWERHASCACHMRRSATPA